MKTALITGVAGQDGSYLAELLLSKNYKVFGMIRHANTPNLWRLTQEVLEHENFTLVKADLLDLASLLNVVEQAQPDEVYNLAAQTFVPESWNEPFYTADATAVGAHKLLEATRRCTPRARFYQASTSELFGLTQESPQNEQTPFHPRSPYGFSKLYAHWATINYRESYDMWALCGILFNHESPRRALDFVTRKITDGVARIKLGLADELRLGNLDAKRDWGFAGDYVRAMWMMMQQDQPREYVIGTGTTRSVQEFCETAFAAAGLDWQEYVVTDSRFLRPAEVFQLVADPSRARKELAWKPHMSFVQLVSEMVVADMERLGASS